MSDESATATTTGPELGLHHVAIRVRELARAEAFYAGVLGLPVRQRQLDEAGAERSVWLGLAGGAILMIERAGEGELRKDESPGLHCLALGIERAARDAWRTKLVAAGVAIERESPYSLFVRDPDGALIALSHHPVSIEVTPVEAEATPAQSGSTVTQRLAALVTLSAVLLALLPPFGVDAQRRRRAREPADVLLVGSSSVNGALGRTIESELERNGLRVDRHGRSSTGLARPDYFDWQEEIASLGDLRALRGGVVVYMGGNDTQAIRLRQAEQRDRGRASWIAWQDEEHWTPLYVERTRLFVEGLCEAGARRVVWVLPADGEREGWAERIHRVQEAQAAGTRGTRCGIIVDPRQPSGTRVRRGSTGDGVHLTRTGARDVWMRIGPPMFVALSI